MTALAAITFTPIAQADGNTANLDQIVGQAYTDSHTGVSYLTYGKQVCQALQSGASPGSEIGRLEGITSKAESELIVTGARQYRCP